MANAKRASARIDHVFRGTFIHSTQDAALQILEDALLGVDSAGKIAFVGKGTELSALTQNFGFSPSEIIQLATHEFFMPGLVDTHIHAPQYSYAGTGLDMPLLQWLETYTFPVESRFNDLDFARNVYTQVVRRTLRNGTTTACYFATIHTDASLLLCQITDDLGQRALVGKVCMDRNNSMKCYKETSQESQEETCRFIAALLNKRYPLVKPVVTPRFALSCTGGLLGQLGAIAKNNNLHIQVCPLLRLLNVSQYLQVALGRPQREATAGCRVVKPPRLRPSKGHHAHLQIRDHFMSGNGNTRAKNKKEKKSRITVKSAKTRQMVS